MHRETKTCMQLVHIHTNMNLPLIAIFFFFFFYFIAQRANVYIALILKPSIINRVGYLILSMRVAMNGPFFFCGVGVKLPTLEVRYKNLSVEAECEEVHDKPLPTLWNSLKRTIFLSIFILED